MALSNNEDNIYNDINNYEENNNEVNTNENNFNENNFNENNTNEVKQNKESIAIEQRQYQNQNESKRMNNQNEVKEQNENKIIDGDSDLYRDQAIKEMEEFNTKLREENENLKEKNKEEVKKSNQLSEKIKDLEKELSDEKKRNENLIKELEALKKNEPIEKKIVEVKPTTENNEEFLQNLLLKDKEISELKKKLENCIILSEGEELISIIFIYEEQHVHYSVICKNVDNLNLTEQKLIEKFPVMKDEEYDYYFDNNRLKRGKKFKELNIDNGAIITVKKRD